MATQISRVIRSFVSGNPLPALPAALHAPRAWSVRLAPVAVFEVSALLPKELPIAVGAEPRAADHPLMRELGIGLVPFAPLGRGFLSIG